MKLNHLLLALALAAHGLEAQSTWDSSKPAQGAPAVSSELRNNWLALERALGSTNILSDPCKYVWAAGDSAAPSYWNFSGAGATITRTGTGLADTTTKFCTYSAKVVAAAGAVGNLKQTFTTDATALTALIGSTVSCGAWVYSTGGVDAASVRLRDSSTNVKNTVLHQGSGWEWLTVTRTVVNGASELSFSFITNLSKTSYAGPAVCVFSPVPPKYPQLTVPVRDSVLLTFPGNISTGTPKFRFSVGERPGIVTSVQLACVTAPTTQAFIVDLNTYDGASYTSMYSTRPQIAASANRGGAAPDTTYARRCFVGKTGAAALAAGEELSLDIDQVGSGTTGADCTVEVRFETYASPWEDLRAYNWTP